MRARGRIVVVVEIEDRSLHPAIGAVDLDLVPVAPVGEDLDVVAFIDRVDDRGAQLVAVAHDGVVIDIGVLGGHRAGGGGRDQGGGDEGGLQGERHFSGPFGFGDGNRLP